MTNELIGTIGLAVAVVSTAAIGYSYGYKVGREECDKEKVFWETEIKAANKSMREYDMFLEKKFLERSEALMDWESRIQGYIRSLENEIQDLKAKNENS